ncbi:polyamine-transporting ATPase 13A3 isoform X1 [Schistocerca gregaria]|uniref:polyamine-transporting ATPase 13A3 isoform X1 n=2 Tax=Schistocerca gregaria TaxID=7010 RepID=UPI00211DF2FD|nr:polyamine-transporting ATPase 13A3 isoform X1 [Schistocerca gregaria]
MSSAPSHKHFSRTTNHRGIRGSGLRELNTGLLEGTGNTMTHPPPGESDFEYINYGEEDQMEIYGYKKCPWKTAGTWTLILLTCGLARLLFHWKPTWMLKSTHKRCSLQSAEKVLVAEQYHKRHRRYYVKTVKTVRADSALNGGTSGFDSEPCWNDHMLTDVNYIEKAHLAVHFSGGSFKSYNVLRLFRCKKQTYVWDEDSGDFHKLCGLDKRVLVSVLHQHQGLTQQEQLSRILAFGPNEIIVPVQSVVTLLFLEVLNPYYVFQLLSFILWFADDYMYYALTILAMSAFGVIMSVIQARKTQHKLRSTIHASDVATVMRGPAQTETVSTDQLVPGDVLVIPRHGYTMNCDAVLLTGNCIVNESMLTGESVPVTKTPLPNHPDLLYDKKEHAKHTLFCGTQIIQARYFGHESVLAVVIRSGFSTSKGELVRAILYPPPVDFKFERDSYRFIGLMAAVAMIGFVYTVVTKVLRGLSVSALILEACDLVTVVVPPALPAAMTVGSFYAQKRLEKKAIYCISSRNINIAGAIDCVCFDKTGTLTEDGLDMWGVVPVQNSTFLTPQRAVSCLNNDEFVFGMATCHSLTIIDGDLSGEPLDLKMFESTGWQLEEHDIEDTSKFDMLFPTVVKPPKGRYTSAGKDSDIDDITLGIVRQFPFSSNLQRMSVIMRKLGDAHYTAYCKGSPEMIASLCHNNTVPADFDTVLQGYAQEGYRVLALAYKGLPKINYVKTQRIQREEIESNLIFLGLIVMENRLKPETTGIIKQLKSANIRTVMITGDNLLTAVSVARECGIVNSSQRIIIVHGKPPQLSGPPRLFYTNASSRLIQRDAPTTELVGGDIGNSNSITSGLSLDSSYTSGTQTLTSIHGEAISAKDDNNIDAADYLFALDGQSWGILRDYFQDTVPKILARGAVFARTSPEQKQQIVQGLQDIGYYVAMCGDGANDCGALKAAHAGISLSEAESSVASPFTSKEANISCVPNLIREGRAALVTSFGIFKYMAAYSLTQFVSVMILYSIDSNLTDIEYLYIDLFIITTFAFFFGRSEAYEGPLFKQPPVLSLVSFSCVLSLVTQAITVTAFQSASFFIIQQAPWFEPFNSSVREDEDGSVECYENYALFAVSSFQYIILALIFSKGAPYRKFIFCNVGFLLTFVVLTGFTVYLILWPFEWLRDSFELMLPPDMKYRVLMLILALTNFVVSAFLEYFIVDHIFIQKLRYELPRKNKSSKLYLLVEEHLKHDFLWPPITKEVVCDSAVSDENRRTRRPIVSKIYSVDERKNNISSLISAGSSHNNEVTLSPATFLEQKKTNISSLNSVEHVSTRASNSVANSSSSVPEMGTNKLSGVNSRNIVYTVINPVADIHATDSDHKSEEPLTVSPKTLVNGTNVASSVCTVEKLS